MNSSNKFGNGPKRENGGLKHTTFPFSKMYSNSMCNLIYTGICYLLCFYGGT